MAKGTYSAIARRGDDCQLGASGEVERQGSRRGRAYRRWSQPWGWARPPVAFRDGESSGNGSSDGIGLMAGRVLLQEDLGAETLLYFESASSRLVAYWSNGEPAPITGERFRFSIDPTSFHVFDSKNGRRLTGSKDSALRQSQTTHSAPAGSRSRPGMSASATLGRAATCEGDLATGAS